MSISTELVNLNEIGLDNQLLDMFRGINVDQISDEVRARFIKDEIAGQFYDNALKDSVTGYSITHKLGTDRKSFRLIMRNSVYDAVGSRHTFDKEYVLDCLFVNGTNEIPTIKTYINGKPIDFDSFKEHFQKQTVPQKKGWFGK